MIPYNKQELLEQLTSQLTAGSALTATAAQNARQASIDAPGAMQSRYDSSKEQEGYLADAINMRKAGIDGDAFQLQSFSFPVKTERVEVGSLVRVEDDNNLIDYFVLPHAGGEYIETDEGEVMVVTPDAPIFQAMQGKGAGERFFLKVRDSSRMYKVSEVI